MNCNEFRQFLEDRLNRRRSVDVPPLNEHAAHCPECAAELEQSILLEQAIEQWNRETPRIDHLADRVVKRSAATNSLVDSLDERTSSSESERVVRRRTTVPAETAILRSTIGADNRRRETSLARPRFFGVLFVSAVALLLIVNSVLIQTLRPHHSSEWVQSRGDLPSARSFADNNSSLIGRRVGELFSVRSSGGDDRDSSFEPAGWDYFFLAEEAAFRLADTVVVLAPEQSVSEWDSDRPHPTNFRGIDHWSSEANPINRGIDRAVDFLLEAVPFDLSPTG